MVEKFVLPQTVTLRIFRRSENRNNFGHREYWLMTPDGKTYTACRVYDLPLNSEITLMKRNNSDELDGWGACGFEVPELRFKDAPEKVVKEIFSKRAVKSDLNKLEMA